MLEPSREAAARAYCGRTAPSSTGLAHPGTLLSALLAWLDARSQGGRFVVRVEDLDRQRSRPAYVSALPRALAWLGLDWDVLVCQSALAPQHEATLDALAGRGLLYPCSCTRARLRPLGQATPLVGTAAYDNHCRRAGAWLSAAAWRSERRAVRLRLPEGSAAGFGDPIVRRRDGSVGYALAAVVDDASQGVSCVVRGFDLQPHAALHAQIYRCLNFPVPHFRHHPLLFAGNDAHKMAKLHGTLPVDADHPPMAAAQLLGRLAALVQLQPTAAPTSATALLRHFSWAKLPAAEVPLRWPF